MANREEEHREKEVKNWPESQIINLCYNKLIIFCLVEKEKHQFFFLFLLLLLLTFKLFIFYVQAKKKQKVKEEEEEEKRSKSLVRRWSLLDKIILNVLIEKLAKTITLYQILQKQLLPNLFLIFLAFYIFFYLLTNFIN